MEPKNYSRPRTRQGAASIGKISSLDSNCLFQGMDLVVKKQSIQTPQKVISSSRISASSLSSSHQQKLEAPTNRTNPRSISNEISDEPINSCKIPQLQVRNALGANERQQNEPNQFQLRLNEQSLTERNVKTNIADVQGSQISIRIIDNPSKGQKNEINKQPRRQLHTERKSMDLVDEILFPGRNSQRNSRRIEKSQQNKGPKSKILIFCLQKLYSHLIETAWNKICNKKKFKKSIHKQSLLIRALHRIFEANKQKLYSQLFKRSKQVNNDFTIMLKTIRDVKKNLNKKKPHQLDSSKRILPKILSRIFLNRIKQVFCAISSLIKKKDVQGRNLNIFLIKLYRKKIGAFFQKARSGEEVKRRKNQGIRSIEQFIRLQLNEKLKFSLLKIIKESLIQRQKESMQITQIPIEYKDNIQQRVVESGGYPMMPIHQAQMYELKQRIAQQIMQMEEKQAKQKELEEILKNFPQQIQVAIEHAECSKLKLLTKIYFSLGKEVEVDTLAQTIKELPHFDHQIGGQWVALTTNLKYKQQIEAYELKLVSPSDEGSDKRRVARLCAYQEQQVLEAKVRSSIKEQYYWSLVKQILSR